MARRRQSKADWEPRLKFIAKVIVTKGHTSGFIQHAQPMT